jgi:anti-sigma factor RsiW
MKCARIRSRLSLYLDGDLAPAAAGAVTAHLESCPACARHLDSLQSALASLASLPVLAPAEGIAARVFDRLEVESRGPGLALVFRSFLASRPLILPSFATAALLVMTVLVGAVAVDRPALPTANRAAAAGTEANPLSPDIGLPQARSEGWVWTSQDALAQMGEGTLFVETVVGRDGSVSAVTLLDGERARAEPVLDVLRLQKFEPVRVAGRPVAVSVYRLISRMDVRSPIT